MHRTEPTWVRSRGCSGFARSPSLAILGLLAAGAGTAVAAPGLAYGLQDDAWITYGPGTISERTAKLQQLGIGLARVTVRWDTVASTPDTFDWARTDEVLNGLEDAGIDVVVTLYGTPGWANGGRPANVPPTSGADFAGFASEVATRYPFVRRWTIWNEPNQRRWLSPASPTVYVSRLLNPAYAAIHDASPQSLVAGGVTAPRAGTGGVSPVRFIRAMGRAGARLDAYAHHPYALSPSETPWSGGCAHCETITMATIGRLVSETRKAFGHRAPVADRDRLPVEPSGPGARRPAGHAGRLHRGGRVRRLGDSPRGPADPVSVPRRARPRSLAERPRDDRRSCQAGRRWGDGSARPGIPQGVDRRSLGAGANGQRNARVRPAEA